MARLKVGENKTGKKAPLPKSNKKAAKKEPAKKAAKKATKKSNVTIDEAVLHPLGKRWQAGESIAVLAKEVSGVSWNKLWSELDRLGYRPSKNGQGS